MAFRWSNLQILNHLGWLNVRQLHAVSVLTLTHLIIVTGKPVNLRRSLVSFYPYSTKSAVGGELRTWAGTTRARDRTASTTRTFKYQAILQYNQIPAEYRNLNQDQFKSAVKKWSRRYVK